MKLNIKNYCKLFFVNILFIYHSNPILSQHYVPEFYNQVSKAKYNDYCSDLRYSFRKDSIKPDFISKQGIFWSYLNLKAPTDTVAKYLHQTISIDPLTMCEITFRDTVLHNLELVIIPFDSTMVKVAKKRCDSIFAKLDSNLIRQLDTISKDDQRYRSTLEEGAPNALWAKQNALDTINKMKVLSMLDEYKVYIGRDMVGLQSGEVVFKIIQHTDLKTQEKYLPMFATAYKNGQLYPDFYAILIDKIEIRKGRPQIYGSQLIYNKKKGRIELYKVLDFKNLNVLREKMNMSTIEYFLNKKGASMPSGD